MPERRRSRKPSDSVLQIRDLHVFYGSSHALQGVDFTLEHGVQAIVGRNGMGKTTLCNAIMGLVPATRGSIRFHGDELTKRPPHRIATLGIGYTPQGRRLWPSLTVDEHMRLSDRGGSTWTIERIYDTFPRLAERRSNGGGQLSGGEQQMVAIARALLQDPELLVLDEPTEGLAPVIVQQVEDMLARLAEEGDVSVLLIEQNIGVATAIAENIAIMVNGRVNRVLPAGQLANDRTLQERLLGVGRHSHEDLDLPTMEEVAPAPDAGEERAPQEAAPALTPNPERRKVLYVPPTRWSSAAWKERAGGSSASTARDTAREARVRDAPEAKNRPFDVKPAPLFAEALTPLSQLRGKEVLVVGTFDTKNAELRYIRDRIAAQGLSARTVDVSTSGKPSSADVPPHMIAAYHRGGASAVFTGDRGASVGAMAKAFEAWIQRQQGIGGIISAAGSGGTAIATPAMRRLPVGIPKVMISTVASGDVGQYVGPSDIMMMYSVTDVQGLNRISKQVLSNGANALVGMVKQASDKSLKHEDERDLPGLGLTMFGVTTTAVSQITAQLKDYYDCLVFHATGVGGRSMEKLVDSGMLTAAIDLTTTEICDMMMGGVFPADEDRFGAFIRTRVPYVGSVGALDMVNFGSPETVPQNYKDRSFVEHNPQVTLMRTTADENRRMGAWIVERLNQMEGPVRFLIPEGGVSAIDAPGQPFHDPEADQALFDAISSGFKETANRRLLHLPHNINDPAFTDAAVAALTEIDSYLGRERHAAL